jgi:hypothetical protein
MEMGEGARLGNVRAIDQKHRVIVLDLIEESGMNWPAVQCPADGTVRWRVAVDMCRHTVKILRDDAGELDVEESEQVPIVRLSGLLMGVDLIPEQEIERRGVIPPWIEVRRGGYTRARQDQDRGRKERN